MTDEKENQVIFSKNGQFGNATVQRGFENATVQNMKMLKNTPIGFAENGSLIIGNDAKLLFEYRVNNKVYSIGVGAGTKFVVQRTTEEKYFLLPEETVKLSPPPTEEQ